MKRGYVNVKEWFFDKLSDTMAAYNCLIVGEYKDGMLDHTILRVDEVLRETEKAYEVVIDAETRGGHYKAWKTWIPKSVID